MKRKERREEGKERMEGWKKRKREIEHRDPGREETDWVRAEVRGYVELSTWPRLDESPGGEGRGAGESSS